MVTGRASPDGCSAAVEVSLCSICPADMARFSCRHFLLAWPLARRFPSWRFSGRTPSIAVRAPRFSIGGAGADDQLGGGNEPVGTLCSASASATAPQVSACSLSHRRRGGVRRRESDRIVKQIHVVMSRCHSPFSSARSCRSAVTACPYHDHRQRSADSPSAGLSGARYGPISSGPSSSSLVTALALCAAQPASPVRKIAGSRTGLWWLLRREYGARAEARRGPNADRRSSHAAIVHLYG